MIEQYTITNTISAINYAIATIKSTLEKPSAAIVISVSPGI